MKFLPRISRLEEIFDKVIHSLLFFYLLLKGEGLTWLMRRTVEIGKFKGYQINDSIQLQILQLAHDTIMMGEDTWTIFGPLNFAQKF
jgi:hypothetical protein